MDTLALGRRALYGRSLHHIVSRASLNRDGTVPASRADAASRKANLVLMAAGDVDIVPAVEQPCAHRRIDRELPDPVAAHDGLVFQVDA